MDEKTIKRLLLARVFALRRNQFAYESLNRPQSVQWDTIQTKDGPQPRCRIVLTAHGCSVATCTMCPLPDEAVDDKIPVTLDHWLNQIREGLRDSADIHTLTLFHNGNFFADREVPPCWREAIYGLLRDTKIKELVVESLPQYLTEERLAHARTALGSIRLNVAIGLQSSSELVRELCIASTCLEDTFEQAIKLLHAQGDEAQVFLMFHPPFLTIEESMWDLRESIEYVQEFGVMPTVCPMKIAPHTVVADLAARGLYEVPDLWHLYQALRGTDHVRVAASLLPDYGGPIRLAFDALNKTGHLPRLSVSRCFDPIKPKRETILARIEAYLRFFA